MLMEDWKQKRGSWKEVEKMYQDPGFLVIIAKMRRIWVVPYYWASIESSDLIKKQLVEDGKIMDRFIYVLSLLIFIGYWVIFKTMVLKFQETVLFWISILGIIPIDLLKRNLFGIRYLEKMALGGNKFN